MLRRLRAFPFFVFSPVVNHQFGVFPTSHPQSLRHTLLFMIRLVREWVRSKLEVSFWEVWDASRSRCFWCLWCLLGAEIGAIYAEGLKELKQARS